MTDLTMSNLGLLLSIVPVLVHGVEQLYPTLARWVVNWVLPFFAPGLPNRSKMLNKDEQMRMIDAALDAAPEDKKRAGEDYVFVMMFEQRQGAICFTAIAVAALYGMSLALVDRDPLHLLFGVVAVLMMLVNANQAGLPIFGKHPKLSINGKHVGFVFAPFWLAVAIFNWLGFMAAIA